ncbi:hypothetical protein EHI8A_028520 [Entamoeba histolytica HM-1:IMSS-B]|nr:hypothetical protein EHI8A_028520 [Entamoeba histolytica HM-1:IMSS-B]EMS11752.1 hypothetical protein KM1_066040 [Entamoeba histolytica HM-3:IMSS]
MNDSLTPIIPIITTFNLKSCLFTPNNKCGYYFIDNNEHKLYYSIPTVPYIYCIETKLNDVIMTYCVIKNTIAYTLINQPKKILLLTKEGNKKVFECNESIIALDSYQKYVIAISSNYLFYLDTNEDRLRSTKHRPLTGWKWIGDCVITLTQMKKSIIYETYQLCEALHLIQSLTIPTTSKEKISFDVIKIRESSWIFSYQGNNKIAHLIEIGPQLKRVLELHVPVNNYAQVAVTGDLLLIMINSIGVLYEINNTANKIAIVKLPPFSLNNLRINHNQFINFNEQTITTLKADFALLSQSLLPAERYSFLLRHSAPQRVLQKALLSIFNDFAKGNIDFETLKDIFTISSESSAISSALVDWRPEPQVYCYVMIEFICSNKTKIPPPVYCRLIESLINDGQTSRLLMLLQYHIIPDDEIVALQLVSMREKCDFAYQFAMDMLKRMNKNNNQILQILIAIGDYAEALIFCISHKVQLSNHDITSLLSQVKNPVLLFQLNQYLQNKNTN